MSVNDSWGWYKAYKIWQREGAMNCAELFSLKAIILEINYLLNISIQILFKK